MKVAELYPSAQVVGVDLSNNQSSWVPANVEFYIDDIENGGLITTPTSISYTFAPWSRRYEILTTS